MDTRKKNIDCYFYYYSACIKGDECMFRHEASALGCETVCSFWQQGQCLNQRCNFRHMELRKNRKLIPCYWENQPGGCRKPHCSFQHKNFREPPTVAVMEKAKDCEGVVAGKPLERSDGPRRTVMAEGCQYEECVGSSDSDSGRMGPRRVSQSSEASYGSPPVDPLVVNFEEESDSESVPTSTPTKQQPQKNIHVKTLEEIRLERVQAESAAFYAYSSLPIDPEPDRTVVCTTLALDWESNGDSDLRAKIVSRKAYRNSKTNPDFRVMTLDEIRKNRQQEEDSNSAMDEKTSGAMNLSRDVLENDLSLTQFDVDNDSATSEARFQIRQRRFASDYNSEEDRVVCSDEDTVLHSQTTSRSNRDQASEPVSVGKIVIKSLAQIRAEKNSVVKDTSMSSIPKKRSHSPIVFDHLPQKHSYKNAETEKVGFICVGDGKRKKPMIRRNNFLESGSDPDEKESFQSPKKLCRFVRRAQHPQTSETRTDNVDVPRRRHLHLRSANSAVHSPERSRVIRLTSDLFRDSEVSVEVPGNITDNVHSDLLEMNGTVCLETGDSGCFRLGQSLTNISDDGFKSFSAPIMSSHVNHENSGTQFDAARPVVSRNSDFLSQSTRNPPSALVRPNHLHTTLNEPLKTRVTITQSSELHACERLDSKLALSTKNVEYSTDADGENIVMKPPSELRTEQRNMGSDDSLLDSIHDNCMTLDAEEDILQDIDDLLSD